MEAKVFLTKKIEELDINIKKLENNGKLTDYSFFDIYIDMIANRSELTKMLNEL